MNWNQFSFSEGNGTYVTHKAFTGNCKHHSPPSAASLVTKAFISYADLETIKCTYCACFFLLKVSNWWFTFLSHHYSLINVIAAYLWLVFPCYNFTITSHSYYLKCVRLRFHQKYLPWIVYIFFFFLYDLLPICSFSGLIYYLRSTKLDQTGSIHWLLFCASTWNRSIFPVVAIRYVILVIFFFYIATLQLKCNPAEITAHIGSEFILTCKYDTNRFLYSKKYWCQGNARDTCEILVDSEGRTRSRKTHRSHIVDAGRRGLFVKVRELRFGDAGVYWVGIDKIYADIMTPIKVVVTEGMCYG